jgi:hypothetical protein
MPEYIIGVYLSYTLASVALIVWIARTLFKNGQVFLDDVFLDNPRMAQAVNHLLVVGFYLFNMGYAFLTLTASVRPDGPAAAIETFAMKLGSLLVALAVMHFGNLYLFHRIRRRVQIRLAPPPVRPQLHHAAAEA